ncbi:MAG: WD40 repeat domain-containing protein [Candidatus Methylacidiphilales bacterium]|nr:WD40 repeat domain-containing protein [Candidatus Methylacidiphilales bacterium]
MTSDSDITITKPSWWKRWYPLWIVLGLILLGVGLSVWRVTAFLYNSQPRISELCWSPDGKSYATSHEDGSVLITTLDEAGNRAIRTLVPRPKGRWDAPENSAYSLEWSPDGKYIAGQGLHKINIWEVATGRESRKGIGQIAFSRMLWAENSRDFHIIVHHIGKDRKVIGYSIETYDACSEKEATVVSLKDIVDYRSINRSSWSRDRKRIAAIRKNTESLVDIVDAVTGENLNSWTVPFEVQTISWSPDRSRIAMVKETSIAGELAVIEIYDVQQKGKLLHTMVVTKSLVHKPLVADFSPGWMDLKWSEDGKQIGFAVCCFRSNILAAEILGRTCLITLWDADSGKLSAYSQSDLKGAAYQIALFEDTSYVFGLTVSHMNPPVWSPDLKHVGIPVEHGSWLEQLGPGSGVPGSPYSRYGEYGTVIIEKAPVATTTTSGL